VAATEAVVATGTVAAARAAAAVVDRIGQGWFAALAYNIRRGFGIVCAEA
jgi:hypothetical protein